MKKKVIIAVTVICLVILLCVGAILGVYFGVKEKKFLKAEVNGMVFEVVGREARTSLKFVNEEGGDSYYKLSWIVDLKMSITNTNEIDFVFQAGSLTSELFDENDNGAFPFRLKSLENTSTNAIITDVNESLTIPAGTQMFFKVEFIYGEGTTIRAQDRDDLINEINTEVERMKKSINGRRKLEVFYITNKIANTTVYMNYLSAETLINQL